MAEHQPDIAALDGYITDLLAPQDDALSQALEEMRREDIPAIHVSASEGKLLHVLALAVGAQRILEIGTLGGYSAIWLARALPAGGVLISLELDAHHADVARRNIERAGLSDRVQVLVGPALESLAGLAARAEPAFDLLFIDADKDGYVGYLEHAAPLVREGGLILADNTLPQAALDASADSGTKRYNTTAAARPDLTSALAPVLRGHGVDGLMLSVKKTRAAE